MMLREFESHEKKTISATVKTVLSIFLVFPTFSNAYGSGFGISTQGASALGQAAAVVAHSGQPSAVFYNPALINDLPGAQIELGTTLTFPSRSFTSALDGTGSSTESDIFYPSTLFLTHAFNDRFSAGFGAFTPFGQGTRWDDNWEGCYITTNAEDVKYKQINIGLSYAYQLMGKRDKLNDAGVLSGGTANGEYESDAHMLAVSLVYRF